MFPYQVGTWTRYWKAHHFCTNPNRAVPVFTSGHHVVNKTTFHTKQMMTRMTRSDDINNLITEKMLNHVLDRGVGGYVNGVINSSLYKHCVLSHRLLYSLTYLPAGISYLPCIISYVFTLHFVMNNKPCGISALALLIQRLSSCLLGSSWTKHATAWQVTLGF